MATVLLYFFGTRISNRQSRFVCPRDRKTRGNPKGGATPLFGTRTLLAKSSVLYPLSAGLWKVGDWDSGRRFWSRQKELCFCARVSHRSKALWLAGRGYNYTALTFFFSFNMRRTITNNASSNINTGSTAPSDSNMRVLKSRRLAKSILECANNLQPKPTSLNDAPFLAGHSTVNFFSFFNYLNREGFTQDASYLPDTFILFKKPQQWGLFVVSWFWKAIQTVMV